MRTYAKTLGAIDVLMGQGVFPGYAVAFLEGGQVTIHRQGSRDQDPASPLLAPGDWYDLASITKALVTSMIYLQEVSQGRIDLDQAIKKWLPKADSRVTLRHLLTHTSGLAGYIPNRNQLSAPELIQAISQLPVTETLGQVVYTDTGFVLAGWILQEELGMTPAQAFAQRFAQPLQLDAAYGPIDLDLWVPTSRDPAFQGIVHDPKARILGKSCGSAGLFASLEACIRLVEVYLGDGQFQGQDLFGPGQLASLERDWTPSGQAGRSLGWDFDVRGDRFWLRHTGFTGTTLVWNRAHQEAMILLTNRILVWEDTPAYNRLREEIVQTYYAECQENGLFDK